MATDRHQPGTRPPEETPGQRQIAQRPDVVGAVLVMGQPHGPHEDAAPSRVDEVGCQLQVGDLHTRRPREEVKVEAVQMCPHGLGARRVRVHETLIPAREFEQGGEHGDVTADPWLQVHIADLRSGHQAAGIRRQPEALQPQFPDRVDDNDLAAAAAQVNQRSHQPGMVTGGIRAGQ